MNMTTTETNSPLTPIQTLDKLAAEFLEIANGQKTENPTT